MRTGCCGHGDPGSKNGYCDDCPDQGYRDLRANPYQVVRNFEEALCRYTGAPYTVTVNSCTMAILLAVAYQLQENWPSIPPENRVVDIPKRTYISVPMSILHAGGRPIFRNEQWVGAYRLSPLPVWDCARRFYSLMYAAGTMQCVSFQAAKILGIEQGGAILHDNPEADQWLRRARYDGRGEGIAPRDDRFDIIGWHCYMSPSVAAQGLLRLHSLPRHNEDLPNDDYPDLSKLEIFK